MKEESVLTFFGVRGSYPVPGKATRRTGGNTASLLLEIAGCPVILDAGSGIIEAGRLLNSRRSPGQIIHIFLSHLHSDHIMGLPFFAPMFDAQAEIVIHYPETADARSRPALEALFLPPYSPITLAGIKARLRFEPLLADEGRTLLEGGIEVAHAWCDAHPRSGVLIYRVRSGNRRVVYATDFESPAGFDDRLRDFAAGADLLIHDSQYVEADYFDNARPRAGFGHSTASMAARNAVACGAGRLFLFHYDPKYSDAMLDEMQAQARAEFPRTFLAREGKSIKIRR